MSSTDKIIAIGGPTAAGKTDLGKMLAAYFKGNVISVDSRQIYKGLDIGTGKDNSFFQYMIDIVQPGKPYSIVDYIADSQKIIETLKTQNRLPILVGGTGYYLEGVLRNYSIPDVKNPELVKELESKTDEELIERLKRFDPNSVARVTSNRRRLVRAVEIVETTNKAIPPLTQENQYDVCLIILDPGVEQVQENIALRLEKRLKEGLISEVRSLREQVDKQWLMSLGLEYFYVSKYLQAELSYNDMCDQLYTAICQYARRQRTWWRRYPDAHWITDPAQAIDIVDSFTRPA